MVHYLLCSYSKELTELTQTYYDLINSEKKKVVKLYVNCYPTEAKVPNCVCQFSLRKKLETDTQINGTEQRA